MAIIKCEHCDYTKEISGQYAGKTVKCPSCGQSTQVHDTIVLFTAFSEKLSEFGGELAELKQIVTDNPIKPVAELNEELTQALGKILRDHRIAMTEFNEATKKRDVITQRTEKRTQSLVRFSLLGFFAMILVLLFFSFEIVSYTDVISKQLFGMNDSVKAINADLAAVKVNLTQLSSSENTGTSTLEVSQNVAKIQASIDTVQGKISKISDDIADLLVKANDFMNNESNSFKYRYYR